ncbi:replication factor A protein, partial [Trifolium medium]|nr:replication factor A protein [Trifolium medium]
VHGIDVDTSVPLIGSRGKAPLDEEFLRMHPKKTMGDLIDLAENGVFSVCGNVVGIVGGEEWWYPACKCHKSVIPDSGAYYCNGCGKHVFQVVPRYC